ncbi:MAG: DUF3789 domain-containing protein [Oscillospiraceae bacterium]|nr:DUF3789 domain-containing protein [Oscillospiraceae bacterium]
MGWFLIGLMTGGTVGVITVCCCTAASWADRHSEKHQ